MIIINPTTNLLEAVSHTIYLEKKEEKKLVIFVAP